MTIHKKRHEVNEVPVLPQAVVDSSVEPGQMLIIPFSVMTEGAGGPCSINARNNREFPMTFPKR